MSAEVVQAGQEIRQAAALMRERAFATFGDEEPIDAWYSPEVLHEGLDAIGADVVHAGDAVHMASWRPHVALAVADWLDAVGKHMQDGRAKGNPKAVAVARAYLGRDA